MARKKMTKAEFAAKQLKKGAKSKGLTGESASAYVYGTLNKIGLKKGSKDTKRGGAAHSRKKK